MSDYQQVVDDLRTLLQANDQTQTDRLQSLVKDFTEQCQAANQRLRRCEEYLKQGLRAEAIQFAQAEPVLLDVVAALDFPERPQLEEVLLFYGMAPPPRLQLSTAEALNQAYAEQQPLEGFLRKHRILALARAPLEARLRVMRDIAMLDVNNPVWLDDVRTFETARINQLQAALTRAASRGEGGRVAEIARELSDIGWFNVPPPALRQQAKQLVQQYAQQQSRLELEGVGRRLQAAFAASDLTQAQPLRERFKELVAQSGLPPSDPVVRHAEKALAWVALQQQRHEKRQMNELEYQTALAALEGALDEQAKPEELTRFYHAVLNLRRNLPQPLEDRYRDALRAARGALQSRERIVLLTIVFIGAIVLLSIVGFLWLRARQPAASEATPGIKAALKTESAESGSPSLWGRNASMSACAARSWVPSTSAS
jgi:hypothetical protein